MCAELWSKLRVEKIVLYIHAERIIIFKRERAGWCGRELFSFCQHGDVPLSSLKRRNLFSIKRLLFLHG